MKKNTLSFVQTNKSLLVVCDLDGTLLNNQGLLSKFTINTIRKFTKEGNIFCIATARPFRSTYKIYEQLGLNSICVNYNGASLDNPRDINFSGINYMFSVDIARTLLNDEIINNNIDNMIIENEDLSLILNHMKDEYLKSQIQTWFHIDENSNIIYGNAIKKIDFNPHTINLIVNNKNIVTVINRIMSLYETLTIKYYELCANYKVVEIGISIATKGHALEYLSSFYGIDISHTIAFGDNDNDIELLRKARFSFAMLNGKESSKIAAKFITEESNDEDGVAKTLARFLRN